MWKVRACVSHKLAHNLRETRMHVHVSTHGQTKIGADNQGSFSSGLERKESQDSVSVCVFVRGCLKRLWNEPRTSRIPKIPTGHGAKYTNHKCPASSNRFRILCMAEQKQQCLWVRLHCISVLASLILNRISLPLFLVWYDNSTLWNIFCIQKCTILYFGEVKKNIFQIPRMVVLWLELLVSTFLRELVWDCLHTLMDRHLFGVLTVSSHCGGNMPCQSRKPNSF